jgi:hypothetical protein
MAQAQTAGAAAAKKRVYVDGKPIPAARIIVKDGANYAEVSTLAEALGATVQSVEAGTMITTVQSKCERDKPVVEGQRFSEQFRSDVAGVADEIESLRAVALSSDIKEKLPLGPKFDEIDRKLALSKAHVQTDADAAVYYALSYASNSLAITYYKKLRGAPPEEAQKNQLDSMMCAMESKFALMKGVLLPGGTCSVFERIEAQLPPKPPE